MSDIRRLMFVFDVRRLMFVVYQTSDASCQMPLLSDVSRLISDIVLCQMSDGRCLIFVVFCQTSDICCLMSGI